METRQVALVTGANRGIGLETVRQLAEQGILTYLGGRDLAKAEAAAASLGDLPVRAIEVDADRPETHLAAADRLRAETGRLDILVNNAGVNQVEPLAPTFDLEAIRATFETNLFGVISITNALVPLLLESPSGRIVNVSTIMASLTLYDDPKFELYDYRIPSYNLSKTALNAYTAHLAHALRDTNVRVNCIHPGWVRTDMGGPNATLDVKEGARTSIEMTGPDAPHGEFRFRNRRLPW